MIIPKLHYISEGASPNQHLDNIQKACTSGIELVRLNVNNVSEKKLLKIAKSAREITEHFQTRLLINNNYKIAKDVKADGVHLENSSFCPTVARKHLYTWQTIGATANTLKDCELLLDKGVDYICLDLNDYKTILASLKTGTPVFASGNMTTEGVSELLENEISGLAISEAITKDFNSIKKFHQLLNASSTAEQRHTFE